MLVIAAEGIVDMELSVGAPADGALGWHTEAVEWATTGCDVNKPVKSSLHFEKMKI